MFENKHYGVIDLLRLLIEVSMFLKNRHFIQEGLNE